MFETMIIRYRPFSRAQPQCRAELLERKHDMSGTTYDHIRYLTPEEVHENKDGARFLYDAEWEAFQQEHPKSPGAA